MKNLLTTLLVFMFATCTALAQDDQYIRDMTSSVEALNGLDKAKPDAEALQEIVNRFEKILKAEPEKWLPRYYAAYCYIMLGFSGNTLLAKDGFLEKGDALLKQAEIILGKTTDELLVLKSFAAQIRLAADPQNRWEVEGEKFATYLSQAKNLNADNPRIYYLEGISLFYTPEEYGGGKKVAKPVLEKSIAKFSAFKPESTIHPNWGKVEAEWMLSQCNQ